MGQPVVHWEFWSAEPGRAAEFYQRVFEWEIRTIPELDYRLVETGGEKGINGGIMTPRPDPGRPSWRFTSTWMTSTSLFSGFRKLVERF
jgi:predicted enzyme related to lactoylglutathione lyase